MFQKHRYTHTHTRFQPQKKWTWGEGGKDGTSRRKSPYLYQKTFFGLLNLTVVLLTAYSSVFSFLFQVHSVGLICNRREKEVSVGRRRERAISNIIILKNGGVFGGERWIFFLDFFDRLKASKIQIVSKKKKKKKVKRAKATQHFHSFFFYFVHHYLFSVVVVALSSWLSFHFFFSVFTFAFPFSYLYFAIHIKLLYSVTPMD